MYMTSDLMRRLGRRLWGSEVAADFSTYEGKAMAAKRLQDRQYAKESLILCDFAWPIEESQWTEDHMGDLTLESQVFSAVTGREVDEDGLNMIGERIFNMQRAVLSRDGHIGRESDKIREIYFTTPLKTEFGNPDCFGPGKDGELIDKKGWVVDRQKFEDMKTEYYGYRKWDPVTGLQTKALLNEMGLGDVVDDLAKIGAIAEDEPVGAR